MHSFKVVATKEKRGIYFTAVPHQWEKTNILYWPENITNAERELLRSRSESSPGEDWISYDCILKCKNIKSFQEALDIEKKLTECSDTDAEESLLMIVSKNRSSQKAVACDRNNLFEEATHTENNNSLILTDSALNNIIFLDQEASITERNEGEQTYDFKKITDELQALKQELSNVKAEILQEIKKIYVKINLSLDNLRESIININDRSVNINSDINKGNSPKEDLLSKFTFPLKTVEEITHLESNIQNIQEFKKSLTEFLVKFVGCSGHEEGTKVAYKIADYLFDPEILTMYTWTGVSRLKTEKQAFQIYRGIIDVIFEVLLHADSRFTRQKTINIFKDGILKHSKKRSQRKRRPKANNPKEGENKELPEKDNSDSNEENSDTMDTVEDDVLSAN